MSQLTPTDLFATVSFLGVNHDSADLTTTSIDTIDVNYAGFVGDTHAGVTRASCVRVAKQYPKGTTIRNVRQISALSSEEIVQLESMMELDTLNPEWVGANIVFSGINAFSQIPPSSRLIAENGTSLVVDMENAPCRFPGISSNNTTLEKVRLLPSQPLESAVSHFGWKEKVPWLLVMFSGYIFRLFVIGGYQAKKITKSASKPNTIRTLATEAVSLTSFWPIHWRRN